MNPVMVVRMTKAKWGDVGEYRPAMKACHVFCPGCSSNHRFTVEVYDGYTGRSNGQPEPVWQWDGNEERPTFSPSMLAYSTVHLCPKGYVHHELCENSDCEQKAHLILNNDWALTGERVLGHNRPHVVNPAWGNCHSFLRNGMWEFLGDSAHELAGQTVPMVPLPDWMLR